MNLFARKTWEPMPGVAVGYAGVVAYCRVTPASDVTSPATMRSGPGADHCDFTVAKLTLGFTSAESDAGYYV